MCPCLPQGAIPAAGAICVDIRWQENGNYVFMMPNKITHTHTKYHYWCVQIISAQLCLCSHWSFLGEIGQVGCNKIFSKCSWLVRTGHIFMHICLFYIWSRHASQLNIFDENCIGYGLYDYYHPSIQESACIDYMPITSIWKNDGFLCWTSGPIKSYSISEKNNLAIFLIIYIFELRDDIYEIPHNMSGHND